MSVIFLKTSLTCWPSSSCQQDKMKFLVEAKDSYTDSETSNDIASTLTCKMLLFIGVTSLNCQQQPLKALQKHFNLTSRC